jgi:serine protease
VAAVRAAAGTGPAEPRLFLSSTGLSFGTVESQLMITVSNGGGGKLTVDAPTVEMDTGQGWLTARLLDSSIIVQVRRDGLSNGVYTGRLNVMSNGGAATVEIRMEVGAPPTPQLGTLYIIALDPVNLDSVGGTETTGEAEFRYVLPPMDIGYLLVAAGTDSDGDGYICEEGEYCGLYPVFSDAVNVRVQANETTRNIDFAVSRRVSPNQASAAAWGKRGFAVPAPNLTPFERILPGSRDR